MKRLLNSILIHNFERNSFHVLPSSYLGLHNCIRKVRISTEGGFHKDKVIETGPVSYIVNEGQSWESESVGGPKSERKNTKTVLILFRYDPCHSYSLSTAT